MRWNGLADAQALKVSAMSTARAAASQRHTDYVHRKSAMEPNAYHKAECWDDDDSDSFMVEWRMDIKSATIIETATKIVKRVSNWRSAGVTCVKLEPRATRTTRNALNELSWERAKPRSLADGTETYLVLKRLVIANDSQELIKRIGHETVNENLNNDVMNSTRT